MDLLYTRFNFASLSIQDVIEARDLFHVHLINKRNVISTAIGRYRIRKSEPWPNDPKYDAAIAPQAKRMERTLENSEVRDYSWPCILVFVLEWEDPDKLVAGGQDDLIPRSVYMPDGRIVPICVVKAPPTQAVNDHVNSTNIYFPVNFIGGGFPIIVMSQGVERIASIGCVVTDGNKYYAITNRHVIGNEGTPVYTRLKGSIVEIGKSSSKQLGKLGFEELYQEWKGKKIFVNNDIGLIEINDITVWKTDVFGIGQIEKLADFSTVNLSLSLITVKAKPSGVPTPIVKAFGAVSGKISGEIVGLFYRYKSVGGLEYVCDFLFGGSGGAPLNINFGDSGTLWLLEDKSNLQDSKYLPLAIQWGQHQFIQGDEQKAYAYALATNLTNVCTKLDVDVVRGWNLDREYSWGKTGHFKIAAKACELVSNSKLNTLLMANQENIGYSDDSLINQDVVSGRYSDARDLFVPLSDVADIIWRSTRKADDANHFADIDESHPKVFDGKALLELSIDKPSNLNIDFWIEYFEKFDEVDPHFDDEGKLKPRVGALPFRVWQMYNHMIKSLEAGKLEEFICAGGTMSHYVGDACQPLHISHLHHGRDESEKDVHSVYEQTWLTKK